MHLSSKTHPSNPLSLTLPELCDHIVTEHHDFVRREGPAILEQAQRLPEPRPLALTRIKVLFEKVVEELGPHQFKEEQVLFPLCKRLALAEEPFAAHCGSVQNPIRVMTQEHRRSAHDLHLLEGLAQQYLAAAQNTDDQATSANPRWVQRILRFCDNLRIHMALENEVLFPLALARETALSESEGAVRPPGD